MSDTNESSGQQSADAIVTTKRSRRTAREMEIVPSDRVELVRAANVLVGHLVTKQIAPTFASSMNATIDLTEQEERSYHAALDFLHRQFQTGFRVAETLEKRVECEDSTEYHPPPK